MMGFTEYVGKFEIFECLISSYIRLPFQIFSSVLKSSRRARLNQQRQLGRVKGQVTKRSLLSVTFGIQRNFENVLASVFFAFEMSILTSKLEVLANNVDSKSRILIRHQKLKISRRY